MKKICLIIVLVSSFSFAQQSDNKFKEVRMSSLNQERFEKTCKSISNILEEYDCEKDLNDKVKIVNDNEELIVQIKKNKAKLTYNNSQTKGLLYYKFIELAKLIND
ncbi:hypothetical protein [Chishuiella changwenlii]|uniref:hypothetical protein n=1 Tax=Chishuiella changwenlii TaxID=1434701 RepID=UPI002FD8FB64